LFASNLFHFKILSTDQFHYIDLVYSVVFNQLKLNQVLLENRQIQTSKLCCHDNVQENWRWHNRFEGQARPQLARSASVRDAGSMLTLPLLFGARP